MRITGLAAISCLVVYVSGAAVFRYAPNGKRQGQLLDDIGLADSETVRTFVNLPTTTSTTIFTPHDATTTTKAFFPILDDILFPLAGPITTASPSASSMVLSTPSTSSSTSPTPTHTHTTTSTTTKSAVPLATPFDTLMVLPSKDSPAPEITSWKPTVSPSSTSSSTPASAASASSIWKTIGIAVSVVTLIGLTILLVVFFEQWTAFVRDVFLCRRSRREDPLGDEEFLPEKRHENYDTDTRSYNRTWAREIRESARLSNIRYPTDVFYGDGSTLGPGKAGIGAGGDVGGRGAEVGEFGQLDRPSRPSFLQRLSMLSLRSVSPVSPRLRTKDNSPGIKQ